MKLQILQENLAKALSTASRFTSNRSQLPILGNILLEASKSKFSVSSTNLEVSVAIHIGAKVDEEGSISIPSKVIAELVGNLPKETLNLNSQKEQLKISSPGFSSSLLGMDSTDFPKIPSVILKDKSLVLPKEIFTGAISQAVFATSLDETRPVLTGVLFVLNKKSITLVATDGFRLSKKELKIENGELPKGSGKIVIPKTILNEVVRITDDSDEIYFRFDEKEKQAVFGSDNIVISSRLIEGEYPDYEKIIPKNSRISVLIDKEEFLRAVKLAAVFARESANIVKIKLLEGGISVRAESGQSGSQETRVDAKIESSFAKASKDSEFEISFNFKFLEDFIGSVKGEEIKMEFTTSDKAGVFLDTSTPDYLHLIMPVRVQG